MIGPTKLCPEGIGLLFLDLDNTILTDGAIVSPRVLDTIVLARERGCMACISTGRPRAMVPAGLDTPAYIDYLVCTNGAAIYDTIGDSTMREQLIARDDALALIDALAPLNPGWNCFIEGEAYYEWRCYSYVLAGSTPSLSDLRASRGGLHTGIARYIRKTYRFGKRMLTKSTGRNQVRSIRPAVEAAEAGVQKMGCSFSSRKAWDRAVAVIEAAGDFEVARVGRQELEITAKGVTKASAAQWLMDKLGVSPACAVAFGDSENDISLADACGHFVAVGNATDAVKELADDVCESVYDDGVARWLERAMAEADGAQHE